VFYEARATQLFYTALGKGDPVILLHPAPLDHRFWLPVAERLQDRYKLIIPDLRGHGWSPMGDSPINIQRLGADLHSLLDHLQKKKAYLAGCSIGGYILFEAWRQIPERVRALVFCCSKPQADSEEGKAKRAATIANIRSNGVGSFFDSSAENLLSSAAKQSQPHLLSEVRSMMMLTVEAAIAVQEGLAARPDSMETARTISVPSLTIAAEEDKASTPQEVEALAKAIPHAEYRLLAGTGHLAAFEQPQLVAEIIGGFLDRAG
jgi:pimeloyl-ACP methyl ester carboxylesterase